MMEKLNEILAKLDTHFRSTNSEMTEKERLFSRVIKLNEEVGELCEAVLSENDRNQREKGKVIDLDAELADIIICTLLIAHTRDKDIWEEINTKLTRLQQKFNLE